MRPRPAAGWGGMALVLLLVVYPLVVPGFWTVQIGAQSLILGIIALSLLLLGGYGGMISLAQLSVAGVAGYVAAYFGVQSHAALGLPLPWGATVLLALLAGSAFGLLVGLVAVRSDGIYMIMITLAIAVGLFYLARQNMGFFNAYDGYHGVRAPVVLGTSLRSTLPFYYLCLGVAAASYLFILHLRRTPFGLALQGLRDSPRRMRTLGYDIAQHRIAAFALAGVIAAVGGVLKVWYDGSISPGTIGVGPAIGILIVVILGGLAHPAGAFIGALLYVLIQSFAIDFIDRDRFNTLIGLVLLAIILFMPRGVVGAMEAIGTRTNAAGGRS
jgi:branched-chain amino acid transport system permease protein